MRRAQHQSFATYEFSWNGSGVHTFRHNLGLQTYHGRYPVDTNIDVGDAYVSDLTTNTIVVTAATAGHAKMVPDKRIPDGL